MTEFAKYKLAEVSKTDLSLSVQIQTLTAAKTGTVTKVFALSGFEAGKLYKYEIRKTEGSNDIPLTQFYVEVTQIINVEVTAGPIFSWLRNPDYELLQVKTENEINYVKINDKGTSYQGNIVLGGTFRPWGYDPRGTISLSNIFFYLGIPLTNTVYENYYVGLGFGGRGWSSMIGAHIGKIYKLKSEYSDTTVYKSSDISVDKISSKDWAGSFFCGIAIDLGVFKKVFPSVPY